MDVGLNWVELRIELSQLRSRGWQTGCEDTYVDGPPVRKTCGLQRCSSLEQGTDLAPSLAGTSCALQSCLTSWARIILSLSSTWSHEMLSTPR